MGAESIKVVIIDPHSMVAEGFAALINAMPDLDALGIATTVETGLALLGRVPPDVVILDLSFPTGSSEGTAEIIRSRWPETAIIMLTGDDPGDSLRHAIEIGCLGFLVKELSAASLIRAIREVHRGEMVIHPPLLREALKNYVIDRPSRFALTVRELEVLKLLGSGTSSDTIATDLYLSRNTVRNHVGNILTKMGAHSKLEAVAMALHEQLISAP
ncbi:MAG TPA: response regulator transcription factor [Acidimicrobiales bacterium]|nr:response regulator transcription factor [Acidimicrobiales bacterium]